MLSATIGDYVPFFHTLTGTLFPCLWVPRGLV